ncbi:MAG: sodium:calcium antiporter [Gammaproteobacteria bacterium]|nr:sodium:calcium antiporter [Gammaproteobacteria bacterium]MDH3430371.1 sodium:calcium antiporter [Gammaproteobacteria bacterium]
MEFVLLLAGLAGLWLGTEATIRGAVGVAERFGVPEFVIGLAILSVGSDLPELAIAIDAAIKNLQSGQTSDVVVGSALGSCLAQIGLVLGVSGFFHRLTLPGKAVYQHGSVLLGSLVLLALFAFDGYIALTEGIAMVVVYVIYLIMLLSNDGNGDGGIGRHADGKLIALIAYLVVGLAIVSGSAELTVSSATKVAVRFGWEQSVIAILLIGLGSSLPELSISVVAAIKRRAHLSIGNLVGSNIFDTLVPIGVAATISGLDFDRGMLLFELPALFALSALVLLFFKGKEGIRKREAWIIIGIYVLYAATKIVNM